MIFVVTTAKHTYTHECLQDEDGLDLRVVTWDDALAGPPDRGAYILTDFDRLSAWSLHLAAGFHRAIVEAGLPVLNDPAQSTSRTGLLRRLYRRGINQFNAYRVEELVKPARWPVFLRCEGYHGPPLSALIHDWDSLQTSIARCLKDGFPVSWLLVVEYAAEPVAPGVFRKMSVFRVGKRLLGATSVYDDQWVVKHGKKGVAPPEAFEEEYSLVRDNPYGPLVESAFDLAGLDYGRADFGLVDGKLQIYEINSNPEIKLRPEPSQIARRNESIALFNANYLAALKELDPV